MPLPLKIPLSISWKAEWIPPGAYGNVLSAT